MVGASSSSGKPIHNINHISVDDFYFSALHDSDEVFPISDELYAEELQLQEALFSSANRVKIVKQEPIKSEADSQIVFPVKELGESSQSRDHQIVSFCFICRDAKSPDEMFKSSNCSHSYCKTCTASYVAFKMQNKSSTSELLIKCPHLECNQNLEPQFCRGIIPKDVCDRWECALSGSLIVGSQKVNCPYKDCSAVLVDDGGAQVVTVCGCPNCHRLFCAQCLVPWHVGMDCKEFQKLGKGDRSEKEDLMLTELAKNNKWRRCPECKFYVEKIDGCSHISCRCGFEFCYGCGSAWSQVHKCG